LELVGKAHDDGRTVMFSSHVLSEIEETCNRVAFLRAGKLAHQLLMSKLFQRHRITADRPAAPVTVPAELADRVTVTEFSAHDDGPLHLRIDTAGDLAPLFPWINSLNLARIRIEPLGLRAVYDAVHFGQEVVV
jgi:ABC-2 type transport system ATP-binding protein